LTDPKNIIVGFWRRVRIETARDIERGLNKIVATLRFDFQYEEESAVVSVYGITAPS
jgi:hypothetical protein